MRAVISVVGRDRAGIIAKVSGLLFKHNINIEDISQTVMQQYFVMIMLVDIAGANIALQELSALFEDEGSKMGVKIHIQHEDIFNAMHTV